MSSLIKRLSSYHKNGVVSLKELKEKNFFLFRYLLKNRGLINSFFDETGIRVMDDLYSYKNIISLYLKYHYGDVVNLTDLRSNHQTVYRHICKIDKPILYIQSLGFGVEYGSKCTENQLFNILQHKVDHLGFLKLDKKTYNRLAYRAKVKNLTVVQYLNKQGFKCRRD